MSFRGDGNVVAEFGASEVGTTIGWTPDGPIGTPEEMRPRLELWKRQQAALERGEDPPQLEAEFAAVGLR